MINAMVGLVCGVLVILIIIYIMKSAANRKQFENFKRNIENYEKTQIKQLLSIII